MKSVDPYLDRTFVPGKYTCLEHTAEVWEALTGNALHDDIKQFLEAKSISRDARSRYKRLDKPVSPCLALFRSSASSHIGVYVRGKVLHLTERDGVQYVPVHVVNVWFPVVRFYAEHPTDR